jgi:hypothetical protein
MDETCAEEEIRLVKRTAQLADQTRALALSDRPFSEAEHAELRDQLRQHKLDLADYQRRCLERSGPKPEGPD